MDWLHLHNDHGELAALLVILTSPAALACWLRARWHDYGARVSTFLGVWRESRCSHPGAREWVTHDYHETIGAWALECQICGLYWDQTHGGSPRPVGRWAAFRRALPALRPPAPMPTTVEPADPF